MRDPFTHSAHSECQFHSGPIFEDSLLSQSEFFLPGQFSYQKGEGGRDAEMESGAGGCERQAA